MQHFPFSFPSLRDIIKGKADKKKENSEGEFHRKEIFWNSVRSLRKLRVREMKGRKQALKELIKSLDELPRNK